MTPEFLCPRCDNKDIRHVLRGREYKPEVACDYGMTLYPHAKQCDKYVPRGHDDGDREHEPG